MIHAAKDLLGCSIAATDGDIGQVEDLLFDDDRWTIRYLVVDTGGWFSGRRVLISPYAITGADQAHRRLPSSVTREQVRSSPDIDTQQPVSRQHERSLLGHYGYPTYWEGGGLWGQALSPQLLLPGAEGFGSPAAARDQAQVAHAQQAAQESRGDPHLRSCAHVQGYHIEAQDGDIGHVHGFLVDDRSWAIRYLIVDTSNWWMGRKVVVAPSWISAIRWEDRKVAVDLARERIREAPAYDPDALLQRAQEEEIFRHYGRQAYWPAEEARERARDEAERSGRA